jgi:hypothetical protein
MEIYPTDNNYDTEPFVSMAENKITVTTTEANNESIFMEDSKVKENEKEKEKANDIEVEANDSHDLIETTTTMKELIVVNDSTGDNDSHPIVPTIMMEVETVMPTSKEGQLDEFRVPALDSSLIHTNGPRKKLYAAKTVLKEIKMKGEQQGAKGQNDSGTLLLLLLLLLFVLVSLLLFLLYWSCRLYRCCGIQVNETHYLL